MAAPPSIPALSVQQPYAELILLGMKVWEYRSRRTNRRGRVYLYASQRPRDVPEDWSRLGKAPDQVPTGLVVGTIDITGCEWSDVLGCWQWRIENPKRIAPRKPIGRPQPVWFYPFGFTLSPAASPGSAPGASWRR